jgi:hypothetical protein
VNTVGVLVFVRRFRDAIRITHSNPRDPRFDPR